MNKHQDTSDATVIDIDALLKEGFTPSELSTMGVCKEKWYRGYNQRLRLQGVASWPLIYGDGVHDTLESFYSRENEMEIATLQMPNDVFLTGEDERRFRYYSELLVIQMNRYLTYYQNDLIDWEILGTEQILQVEFEGLKFTGKIDLVIREGEFMGPLDHKTIGAFAPEFFAGFNFRFQFLYYAWLWWKHSGDVPSAIWWNCLKKPQLKQKKDESFESFMVRIEGDMRLEPDKYFKRQKLPTGLDELKHFEKRVLGPKISQLKALTEPSTSGIILESLSRDMNTDSCIRYNKPCEFLPLCEHGWHNEGSRYTRRETKHEELDNE